MKDVKYLILGAGPSGLSFASTLQKAGEKSFCVLEKEPTAGGLCKSRIVDGMPLDTGGGHFLDVKRRDVLEFIFSFLHRSEWNEFERISKIKLRKKYLDYPLESNLWQLPVNDQADFLESIAQAGGVSGMPMPDDFEGWISWKLGARIAEEYMLPYNKKLWSCPLKNLGTYWLYKLPSVSFRETLISCLSKSALGSMPAHAKFLYPINFGYGEVWERIGRSLGDRLILNQPVNAINWAEKTINSAFRAKTIVTTIPWTTWHASAALPSEISAHVKNLASVGVDIDYYPDQYPSNAHWIYDPDETVSFHRILVRSNFVPKAKGYWTETNPLRADKQGVERFHNEFAYPLNTVGKPRDIKEICDWALANSIIPLGRWGLWEHMNSDVAVEQAILAAQKLIKNNRASL